LPRGCWKVCGVDRLPLVVELEGSLTRADIAAERRLLRIAGWFTKGRSEPDPLTLPLHQPVVDLVQREASQRPVLIVGGLTQAGMEEVARRLDAPVQALAVPARDAGTQAVVSALSGQSFALLAAGPRSVALRALATEVLPDAALRRAIPVRALRPHHWVKNLLVFIPILAAHRWDETGLWLQAALTFAAFSMASSAVYLTNDLFDIEDDRAHPIKRLRPLASAQMRPAQAILLAVVTFVTGIILAAAAGVLVLLGGYAVASLAYSLKLKTLPVIDLICLVGLYTLRLLAGGMTTGIAVSGWLLAYGGCVFASLALAKRCAELTGARAGTLPLPSRRGYRLADRRTLAAAGLVAAVGSVGVLMLYLEEAQANALYDRPGWLLLAGAIVLAWLIRVWWLVTRNRLIGDPIVFALRDPASLAAGSSVIALLVLAAGT
jgi:4-hydroxybenzoate polyprenyltransferase